MTLENGSQNTPTPDRSREPHEQADKANPEIPPASTKPEFQPPKTHCDITCKTEKNWWNKAKPFVELAGIILLAVYTGFTIAIYCISSQTLENTFRPRIAITSIQPIEKPEEGKLAVSMKPFNYGSVAATNIRIYRVEQFGRSAEGFSKPPQYSTKVGSPPNMLVPNAPDDWKVLGERALATVPTNEQFIAFSVMIEYRGGTARKTYHTEECGLFRWNPPQPPTRTSPCPWNTQAD